MNTHNPNGENHPQKPTRKHHGDIPPPNRWRMLASLTMIVSMLLLSSGCANRILNADFDAFGVNTADSGFAGDLPDIPDGDAIEPHPSINGSLSIEVNGPAGGGNNLRIVDTVSGIPGPALISFVVAEHTLPDEYRIVWEGATQSQIHHTEVLFLDENGREALRLTFTDQAGGIQALIIASGSESFDFIEVDPATPHEVLVTINPAEGLASVRYDGSGGVETRQNLAFKDPGFKKLKFVRFGGFKTTSAYFLSHLNVVAKSN